MTTAPVRSLRKPLCGRELVLLVVLILAAWAARLCCLASVPPGWRNDELINMLALSGEVMEGRFPLYFTGASGHEPLYHYLHAGLMAVAGVNLLSGHLLSIALGTLNVVLTYVVARRLLGRRAAVVSSFMLAASFWSLMYSRLAIRHIIVPPLALATVYWTWRLAWSRPAGQQARGSRWQDWAAWLGVGLLTAALWYSYPAGRLMPAFTAAFIAYLALVHRRRVAGRWRGAVVALLALIVVVLPLQIAIAEGRSEAARLGIGADARLSELAAPLRELQEGNPLPLLENTLGTLAMFYPQGDPEWLYNIAGRPLFGLLGGVLFWSGVVVCLVRWRQARNFLLLVWLGVGLVPTFVSIPPGSLSHTILAQPVVYILFSVGLLKAGRLLGWVLSRFAAAASRGLPGAVTMLVVAAAVGAVAWRDLHDYFDVWPERGMVRLQYHADYRELGRYLDGQSEYTDVAVATGLQDPWGGLALGLDMRREDVAVRLFSPERALVWVGDSSARVVITGWPEPGAFVADYLAEQSLVARPGRWIEVYELCSEPDMPADPLASFANHLVLLGAEWVEGGVPLPGAAGTLRTTWLADSYVDYPISPIVAYPPPPGVYFGPRLAVFAHLIAQDGTLADGDDGLWVDPTTLRPGDRFVQFHEFSLDGDPPDGCYRVEMGLYDPHTGERWHVLDAVGEPAGDRVSLEVGCAGD